MSWQKIIPYPKFDKRTDHILAIINFVFSLNYFSFICLDGHLSELRTLHKLRLANQNLQERNQMWNACQLLECAFTSDFCHYTQVTTAGKYRLAENRRIICSLIPQKCHCHVITGYRLNLFRLGNLIADPC